MFGINISLQLYSLFLPSIGPPLLSTSVSPMLTLDEFLSLSLMNKEVTIIIRQMGIVCHSILIGEDGSTFRQRVFMDEVLREVLSCRSNIETSSSIKVSNQMAVVCSLRQYSSFFSSYLLSMNCGFV